MSRAELFHPGGCTPGAGTFVCDCSEGHVWRIDLAGHVFPSLPPSCSGTSWRLTEEYGSSRDPESRIPA
ncbi:hypothetical protein C5L38_00630 [Streptomyces sp. WAC00288]|nr:hypothetical protein C5L38_00630 [Streptomyces sp. WAC00288]PVC76591.1 hypothetical protein DBP18_07880 [Streptomyces sp. CS081A]